MNVSIKRLLVVLLAVIAGLVFIFLGFIGYSQMKNFDRIDAEVTRVEYEDAVDIEESPDVTVYVHYKVEGKDYEEVLQYASGDYKAGDQIQVLCDPSNPTYVSGASRTSSFIYMGFGVLCLAGGLLALLKSLKR